MLYPARRRRAAGEKTARDGKRLKRLELEELKKLAKFANGVGEDRSVRQGGRFSDGGPGRDFGRRVSIGGVPRYLPARINWRRSAVLAGAAGFPALMGSRHRGPTGFGRLAASRRIWGVVLMPEPGGAGVSVVPDPRMTGRRRQFSNWGVLRPCAGPDRPETGCILKVETYAK